jgi:hypothetical protein
VAFLVRTQEIIDEVFRYPFDGKRWRTVLPTYPSNPGLCDHRVNSVSRHLDRGRIDKVQLRARNQNLPYQLIRQRFKDGDEFNKLSDEDALAKQLTRNTYGKKPPLLTKMCPW